MKISRARWKKAQAIKRCLVGAGALFISGHAVAQDDPSAYGPPINPSDLAQGVLTLRERPPFVPAELEAILRTILERDPSIVAAQYGNMAARSDVLAARWARFPNLSGGFDLESSSNSIAPSVQISVPVWAGGSISANLNRAKQLELSSAANLGEVALQLSIEVSSVFYEYVNTTRLERIYSDSLTAHADLVATMQRRVQQEVSPKSDLELARSRYAQIEQELAAIISRRESSFAILRELTQDETFGITELPTIDLQAQVHAWQDAVTQAQNFSPTLRRLNYDVAAAFAEKDAAKSALFPQVSVFYRYDETFGGTVGLSTRVQSGNGLSQFSAVSAADARARRIQSDGEFAARQLRQEVQTLVAAQLAAQRRASISLTAATNARSVSESYRRQFITGRRSWLDLMNSLREDLSSKISQQEAENATVELNTRLALLTGLWDTRVNNGH